MRWRHHGCVGMSWTDRYRGHRGHVGRSPVDGEVENIVEAQTGDIVDM